MLACGACACVAGYSEFLSGLDNIACLDIDRRQVHIGVLHPASVIPFVFNGDGLSSGTIGIVVDSHHLAIVFGCQYRIPFTTDVNTLVHLLLGRIHRVGTHTEWRGDKQKFLTPYRK